MIKTKQTKGKIMMPTEKRIKALELAESLVEQNGVESALNDILSYFSADESLEALEHITNLWRDN